MLRGGTGRSSAIIPAGEIVTGYDGMDGVAGEGDRPVRQAS